MIEINIETKRGRGEIERTDIEIEIDANEWGIKKGGNEEDKKSLGKR